MELLVIGSSGSEMEETAGNPTDEKRVIDGKLDHSIQRSFPFLQKVIQLLGLNDRPREPI